MFSGNVCGVSIPELNNTRISLSKDEIIHGHLMFDGHVFFRQDVTITGDILNLTEVQLAQNEVTSDTEAKTGELVWVTDKRCKSVDALQFLYNGMYSLVLYIYFQCIVNKLLVVATAIEIQEI